MAALLSRPARGGWIEIKWYFVRVQRTQSRPARGGWIEILQAVCAGMTLRVPPRMGRVD